MKDKTITLKIIDSKSKLHLSKTKKYYIIRGKNANSIFQKHGDLIKNMIRRYDILRDKNLNSIKTKFRYLKWKLDCKLLFLRLANEEEYGEVEGLYDALS